MNKAFVCAAVVFLMVYLPVCGNAQTATGSLVGTATDSSGAVLPGVSVKLSRAETGFQRELLTNERGDYQFLLVPVGVYTLETEFPGFKSESRQGVTIQTDIRSRVDFKLQLGKVSEKISVTEDAPLLRSETSEVGTVMNNRTVQELPLNGRQFQSLAFASPGVTFAAPGSTIQSRGSIVVAGKRETSNTFILDGMDITQQNVRQPMLNPSVESMQEFKMETWNYTAEFGRQSGGQLNMTTKSGTNEIHGVAYEFLRNSAMDAKNYFDPKSAPIPPLKRSDFGGTIGGPIIKDKTFAFLSIEGLHQVQSFSRVATVPLPQFWNGDFSTLLQQPKPIQLVNPITHAQFPGNIVPTNLFNSAALITKTNVYPSPNLGAPGQLTNNFESTATGVINNVEVSGRIDHRISANHNIFGRYSYEHQKWVDPYDTVYGISNLPNFPRYDAIWNQSLSINETWAIRPTVVNEFRTGFTRFTQYRDNTNKFDFIGAAGFQGFDPSPINFSYPALRIAGYEIGKPNEPLALDGTREQVTDSVSMTLGSHTIKFGADIMYDRIYKWNNGNARGSFTFSGGLSGYSFVDFLLGLPASGNRALGDTHTWMSW